MGTRGREGRWGQVPGPGTPFPCSSRDDSSPSTPCPRGPEGAPRGSCNFPETSAGVWQTSASSCSARSRGGGAAEECVMGTLGSCQVSAGAPLPSLPCGLSGSHLRSHPRSHPRAQPGRPANSLRRFRAGAAVRGWYQDGEERALPRLGARAGVLRSGQRSLTFLGLAPGWGHREQPSDPSEWLVRCAPLGSFSGIRCLRPGPSPLRNETCLPGRRKAMTVSWLG